MDFFCGLAMFTKWIVFILVLLIFITLAPQARAVITIYGIEQRKEVYGIPITDPSEKYDRFYSGSDRDFIGEGYDWSGVGWSSDSDWATMISPQYFLAASHAPPAYGATVTFYENNTKNPAAAHTYVVDDWSRNYWSGRTRDLYLGRLTQPISEDIAFYPILDLPAGESYIGRTFFAYGCTDRVGRNQIDGTAMYNVEGVYTYAMTYDYDNPPQDPPEGVGDDECLLQSGDSGGPSLIVYDDELALVGIHWFHNLVSNPKKSGDSFVPHYVDEIHSYVNGGDANMDGIVNDIDATILAANWNRSGASWTQGDFNGDELVDETDAARLTINWLRSTTWLRAEDMSIPGATGFSTVPEPAAAVLLLSGLALIVARRLRRVRAAAKNL